MAGEVAIDNIFDGPGSRLSGYIDQISIRASSGGGANVDIEIRGDSASSEIEDLFYKYTAAVLPFIDSNINSPFDTKNTTDKDLSLYLKPALSGVFEIRIDFKILAK